MGKPVVEFVKTNVKNALDLQTNVQYVLKVREGNKLTKIVAVKILIMMMVLIAIVYHAILSVKLVLILKLVILVFKII